MVDPTVSEIADLFYTIVKELLSSGIKMTSRSSTTHCLAQNSASGPLLNSSTGVNRGSSRSDFTTEIELANDQRKVHDYLLKLDKKLARDFTDLFNAIRYDVSTFTGLPQMLCLYV